METVIQTATRPPTSTRITRHQHRPSVRGKFIFLGQEKLLVKGVTYGTFRPTEDGCEYHDPETVGRDFAAMAANGINAVRTYTVPPRWFLDIAQQHGLHVMVGIPWEQHMAIMEDSKRTAAIEQKVRASVRACAGHPAILCYSVGNEIPAAIVRWHGRKPVERFIKRLYEAAKEEDPKGLVTYVNYPSTEYLQLSFLDFVSFNVYLESQEPLEAYYARLQNKAGDRPLLMAEVGLDSHRNGAEKQARVLDWQIHTTFASGCAGMFVFAWTDEWFRGGHDILDWDFGLTMRDRRPKPALEVVRDSFAEVPFPPNVDSPKISVAICARNEEDHIGETLAALRKVDYPDFEVIVVDDGSTDSTAAIARRFGAQVISTENRGLSSARNTAMEAATGEIVAYIDGDAYPDPHWLRYLAYTFSTTSHVGVGGPNIHPPGDGMIAECVANAPGGPIHVLLSDSEAEHIPGCNMAFRRNALLQVGGFDPQFRAAGDDVDLCWRLQERGWTLGFSPAAVVWHHRRDRIGDYWKQQKGYGKAEAMLERKWPEKYNGMGHLEWKGRLYGSGHTRPLMINRWRIYHGMWGTGLFQSIYASPPRHMSLLPLMPEWLLMIAALAGLSALSLLWAPLLLALPLFIAANGIVLAQAIYTVSLARFGRSQTSQKNLLRLRLITVWLHLMQPMARLIGRIQHGLTPWRRRREFRFMVPKTKSLAFWSEVWRGPEVILQSLEDRLRQLKAVVLRGGDYDGWDLEVSVGANGFARVHMTSEEHGGGKQMIRFRIVPATSRRRAMLAVFFIILATLALLQGAWIASLILGLAAVGFSLMSLLDSAGAMHAITRAISELSIGTPQP